MTWTSALCACLPVLFLSSAPLWARHCEEVASVCVEGAGTRVINGVPLSRECWRYEHTYRCEEVAPEAQRCERANVPPQCQGEAPRCTENDTVFGCLEEARALTCTSIVSAPGITLSERTLNVSFQTQRDALLPENCRITRETCLDNAPRDLPVNGNPDDLTRVSADCWDKALTVSCPSAESAPSCHKLVEAGCQKISENECLEKAADGSCLRYGATFRCQGVPVTGDDITLEASELLPQGTIITDESACESAREAAQKEGLHCETLERVCLVPGETRNDINARPVTLDCREARIRLLCRADTQNGCAALEALQKENTCRLEGEKKCLDTSDDGTCLKSEATFLCGETLDENHPPQGALFLEKLSAQPAAKPFNECTPYQNEPGCRLLSRTCLEGPGIKLVENKAQYRDCWQWRETYACESALSDECQALKDNKSCTFLREICSEDDPLCLRKTALFRCTTPGKTGAIAEVCDGEACIEGACLKKDDLPNEDFAESLLELELARQAAIYGDVSGNEFFKPQHLTCKDRKGAPSCCRNEVVPAMSNSTFGVLLTFGANAAGEAIKYVGSPYVFDILSYSDTTAWLLNSLYGSAASGVYSPNFSYWGVGVTLSQTSGLSFSFSPAGFMASAALTFWRNYSSCSAEDQKTAMAKGARLCHFVGVTCDRTLGGGCVKRVEHYACFNSRLARILHEQGRPQLGRTWGTGRDPDLKGFSMAEIEKLDFSRMDLSEFAADIVQEALDTPDALASNTYKRAQARVKAMLEESLSPTSPLPGPTGKRRTSHEGDIP